MGNNKLNIIKTKVNAKQLFQEGYEFAFYILNSYNLSPD
jgi:hypothetical protein